MPHTLSPRQIANALNPELKFRLDQWSDRGSIERILGWIDDFEIAQAAFAKACEIHPDKTLTLRWRARIVAEHPRRESRS